MNQKLMLDIFGQEQILEFIGPTRWLSNFQGVFIEYRGEFYPSTEHAYQAAKTLRKNEEEWIRNAPTPGNAKKRGKYCNIRSDWDNIKRDVMLELLRKKYNIEPFKSMLLATGESHLEEGNTWGDKYWGTVNRVGENWLGRLTMQVREELRNADVQRNTTSSS